MGRYKITMAQRAQIDKIMDDGEWRTSIDIASIMGIDCKHTSSSICYWLIRKAEQNSYVVERDTTEIRKNRKIFRKVIAWIYFSWTMTLKNVQSTTTIGTVSRWFLNTHSYYQPLIDLLTVKIATIQCTRQLTRITLQQFGQEKMQRITIGCILSLKPCATNTNTAMKKYIVRGQNLVMH